MPYQGGKNAPAGRRDPNGGRNRAELNKRSRLAIRAPAALCTQGVPCIRLTVRVHVDGGLGVAGGAGAGPVRTALRGKESFRHEQPAPARHRSGPASSACAIRPAAYPHAQHQEAAYRLVVPCRGAALQKAAARLAVSGGLAESALGGATCQGASNTPSNTCARRCQSIPTSASRCRDM